MTNAAKDAIIQMDRISKASFSNVTLLAHEAIITGKSTKALREILWLAEDASNQINAIAESISKEIKQ